MVCWKYPCRCRSRQAIAAKSRFRVEKAGAPRKLLRLERKAAQLKDRPAITVLLPASQLPGSELRRLPLAAERGRCVTGRPRCAVRVALPDSPPDNGGAWFPEWEQCLCLARAPMRGQAAKECSFFRAPSRRVPRQAASSC